MVAARRRPPMSQPGSNAHHVLPAAGTGALSYWRVEGSLLDLGALRPVGLFTWTSQSFSDRCAPRAPWAWIASGETDGRSPREKLLTTLGWTEKPRHLENALKSTARPAVPSGKSVALFGRTPRVDRLSVRENLANRHLLLIGVTGFIGKVWLVDLLQNIPNVGKITLLIRRNRTTSALRRFEKIVEESPAFDILHERHGRKLGAFLKQKLEVVEGDVSLPGLGLDEETQGRLANSLDLIVNSAGLTDFNPDLRDALSSNVDSAIHLLDFLRKCHS